MNRPTITYDGQTMFCSYRKSPKENLRMEMMRMLMLTMTIGKNDEIEKMETEMEIEEKRKGIRNR